MKRKKLSPPSLVFVSLVILFMYLPVLMMVLYSFNANDARNSAAFTGFTLRWYQELFSTTRGIGESLWTTIQLGVLSTLLATVIGTAGAIGLSRMKLGLPSKIGRVAETLMTLPIMIPEIVLGMAFMALFYLVELPFGMLTLTLAHTTFCVPYILIVVRGRLAGMDPALEEAARDLGASPRRVLWDIILPLVSPAVLSGAFLALAMSLDDLIISFFVTGAGVNTLPLYIYSSVKTGVSLKINALATLMLVIAFAVGVITTLRSKKASSQ